MNLLRVIAHESILIVDLAKRAESLLGLDSVAADIELLAVFRVGEGGVGQGTAVGSHHFTIRAGETVVEQVWKGRRLVSKVKK